jgi:hypothetical protein
MPEQPPKSVEKLADDINELESLIDGRKTAGAAPAAPVPILDDLVEAAAAAAEPAGAGVDAAALEQRLLRRVDAELSDLANVIREVVRRCIQEELEAAGRGHPPPAGKSEAGGD